VSNLEERLAAIVRETPGAMHVMTIVRGLGLPDWMLFSGAVYQPIWNRLTGRPADHGVKDYDLAYFDSDTSYEAEDRVIRRVAAAFAPPFTQMVEVRNQARVHLWFERHFGEPYAPLASSAEALSRFAAPAFAVGVRLEPSDQLTIFAPFGLDDLFAMRVRPNPMRPSANFAKVAAGVVQRWPEVTVEGEKPHAPVDG
jgi:hypothetical protein